VNWDALGKRNSRITKTEGALYSVGIHPWDAQLIEPKEVEKTLSVCVETMSAVAIGECGLDRACKVDFGQQKRVFLEHLTYASNENLPVVIHCVKAWSDIIPLFKTFSNVRYILHDFRANIPQTQKLLEFDTYFSFGKSVLKPTSKLVETIKIVPHERILTETDDAEVQLEAVFHGICLVLQAESHAFRSTLIANTRKAYKL
jgi:TatD DNase family protein